MIITECKKCNKLVWPNCKFCSICLEKTRKRDVNNIGKIIEFSKKDKTIFCIGEFEQIRIIGTLQTNSNDILPNSRIKLHTKNLHEQLTYFFTLID